MEDIYNKSINTGIYKIKIKKRTAPTTRLPKTTAR